MKLLKAVIIFCFPLTISAQNYYGGIPAIFDDFSYTNTDFPIAGDSSNSLYGKNIWLTENGRIPSKAWHRFNWGDADKFGAHSGIIPRKEGVTVYAEKGFRFGDVTPGFMSGFVLKEGTYVSRVRFGALPLNTNTIQAFWLYSPDTYRFKTGNDSITYVNEVDFEWNNWFMGRGEKRVNASTIGAIHSKKGSIMNVNEMNFFQYDDSGRLADIGKKVDSAPEYYFENRWYYYLIRLDSTRQTAEFLMESAEEGNIDMKKVYAGSAKSESGNIIPLSVTEHYPHVPLMAMYNFGTSSTIKDSVLKADMKIDVDWFYYTPRIDMSIREVLKETENFRAQNIPRINTLGVPMQHDILKIHTASITGPDSIRANSSEQWIVEPSLKNALYDIEFSYRFKTSSGFKNWIFSDNRTLSITPNSETEEIEFKAMVLNYWSRETMSVTKTVKVLP
ncbi:MAG: hypothetical protein V4642_11035 [Bacteroidota bacterium]